MKPRKINNKKTWRRKCKLLIYSKGHKKKYCVAWMENKTQTSNGSYKDMLNLFKICTNTVREEKAYGLSYNMQS